MKIKKILIANRGEIACRIAKSCKKLGVQTVAIYSDADENALHVHACDEAEWVGESESAKSYLNASRIIEIAKETGADAIHPGYGFLSENADFAEAVAKAGLTFIGPSPQVIRLLGDKVAAKAVADKVSAPTISGLTLTSSDIKPIQAFVKKAGYPILIKAAAGGGGRGMRKVYAETELGESLASASREAKSFFGDERVFIEQLIENARHIEVQILGDMHGNVMHLGTRDCTFQRNHQKVIEEAPAPLLPDAVREKIHSAAVKICTEAGYQNAGTVEFLLKGDSFYFLEVNSRLQVEHPVTESVYGVDLVELQIQVACGEKLSSLLPNGVTASGHALQCRICSELPRSEFQADTGTILDQSYPDGVRVDTGYGIGSEVSYHYDSLFAKLITFAPTRDEAIQKTRSALEMTSIVGVQTNLEFLLALLQNHDFRSVTHHTYTAHTVLDAMAASPNEVLVALAALFAEEKPGYASPWDLHDGFRITGSSSFQRRFAVGAHEVTVKGLWSGSGTVELSAPSLTVEYEKLCENMVQLRTTSGSYSLAARRFGAAFWISGDLGIHKVIPSVEPLRRNNASGRKAGGEIKSPLPGKILSLKVSVGDAVQAGATILVLESMKMEHTVSAPAAGTIESLSVTEGVSVSRDQVLCVIKV